MNNKASFEGMNMQIIENMPVAIVLAQLNGTIVFANHAACKFFEIEKEDFLYKSVYQFIGSELFFENKILLANSENKRGLAKSFKNKTFSINYSINLFKNNSEHDVLANIAVLKCADEPTQPSLLAHSEQLALNYNLNTDLFFALEVHSNSYQFIMANKAFLDYFKVPENNLAGKNLGQIVPSNLIDRLTAKFEEAIHQKKTIKWEEEANIDNEFKIGLVSVTPVFDSEDKCTQLIGSVTDITENKLKVQGLKENIERFNFVTKATSAAVWDWNIANDSMYWGAGFDQLFGYNFESEKTNISKSIHNIHPDDRSRVEESLHKVLATNASSWVEQYRYLKSNGNYAYIEDKAIIIRDRNQVAQRMIGAMNDISMKIAEEQQLKLYKSVVTNTSDCIIITEADISDKNGPKIIYVNDSFTKMTGYKKEEIIGNTPRILQGPNTDRNVLDRLKKSLINAEPCEVELINYNKNKEEFWVNLSIFPLKDAKGKPTHFVSIQRDTTERNKQNLDKETIFEIIQSINKNPNLSLALQDVLKSVCEYLGFHYGEIWSINMDETRMVFRAEYKISNDKYLSRNETSTSLIEKGEGLPGISWQLKERIYIKNLQLSDFIRKEDAAKSNLVSGMALPIYFNNEVIAVFNLFSEKEFTKEQLSSDLLNKLTTQIGAYIQKNRKELELSQFFKISPDMLAIASINGYFRKVNPAFSKILGYSEQELLSRPYLDFVHPDDKELTYKETRRVEDGNITLHLENRYIAKNGDIKWFEWTCVPLHEEALIFSATKDITEKKKMDEERKELIKELTINNRELKQFSYITSHNMRSPLTNLLAILEMIDISEVKNAETLALIDAMKTSTNHLNDTLNDLIKILIIKENTNLNLEKIKFKDILQKVTLSINSLIENSGTIIYTHFETAPSVIFNNSYLESIFLNLITNSIKYSKPNEKPIITIKTFFDDNRLKLEFRDNGIGFNEEKVKGKIFGLYQRFHNHADSKGIGLYLVQSQITALGGTIDVSSQENEGTVFTISFKPNNWSFTT
jgi:PAS domain S-box-containing protein